MPVAATTAAVANLHYLLASPQMQVGWGGQQQVLGILSIQGSTWTPGATSGLQIRFTILWLLVHGGANAVACVASLYFAPVPWE